MCEKSSEDALMYDGASSYHRFISGDKDAFGDIVRYYGDSLVCFAYCILRDSDAAEDAVADTFATLLVKPRKFVENAKFKTYLYAITRNKCMDVLRAQKRRAAPCDIENLFAGDSESEIFARERDRRVYICMQNLPEQYRDVLYLEYFDGFSAEEICKIMKKNRKQVYNLTARAKSSLKELLVKEDIFDEKL